MFHFRGNLKTRFTAASMVDISIRFVSDEELVMNWKSLSW